MKPAITLAILILSFGATAQESAVQAPELPLALQYQFNGTPPVAGDICRPEMERAGAAVGLRDKGKTKAELAAGLPAMAKAQPYMAAVMASILDDVYANPSVKKYPYFAYRSASCYLRVAGKPAPATFAAVADKVLSCQSEFGEEPSDPYFLCIQTAVASGVP